MDRYKRYLTAALGRRRGENPNSARFRMLLAGVSGVLLLFAAGVLAGAWPQVAGTRHERQAEVLLARTASGIVADHDARALGLVVSHTEALLAYRPTDASAWLRLAYVERLSSGRLDEAANASIVRSYRLAPLGPEVSLWRLGFIFDNWSSASREVRALALAEMEGVHGRQGWEVEALVPTFRDSNGRMAAALAAQRLRRRASED